MWYKAVGRTSLPTAKSSKMSDPCARGAITSGCARPRLAMPRLTHACAWTCGAPREAASVHAQLCTAKGITKPLNAELLTWVGPILVNAEPIAKQKLSMHRVVLMRTGQLQCICSNVAQLNSQDSRAAFTRP